MKYFFGLTIFLATQLYAVHIGTATHFSDRLMLGNYLLHTTADKKTDINGDTTINNFGFELSQYVIRPILYKGDFVYQMILPYKIQKSSLLQQEDYGIGDTKLGIGYFIPNSLENTDLGVLVNIQLPTGEFDKTRLVNNGSGHYATNLEFYIHKMINRIMWDSAIKYNYNFENPDTNERKGDEFLFEASFGYVINPKFLFGPNFTYSLTNDNELNDIKQSDTRTSKFNAGVEGVWVLNKQSSLLLGVFQDFKVKNTLKTNTFLLRYFYSF